MNNAKIKMKVFNSYRRDIWFIFIMFAAIFSGLVIVHAKWLYLMVFFIPLVIYMLIEKPFIFPFGLYVFFIPFDSVLVMTGSDIGPTLTKLFGMLTILILSIKGLHERKLEKPDNVTTWWILFVFYSTLSGFWAVQPEIALSTTYIALLIFYLVVASYKVEKKDLETLKLFIIAGGFFGAFYMIYEYITGGMLSQRATLSLGQHIANPNRIAFAFLIPFALCIEAIIRYQRILMKCFYILALGIIFVAIVMSGSRGNMLGVLAISIIYIFYSKKKITIGIIFITVTIITLLLVPEIFFNRWSVAVESGGDSRIDIWLVGLKSLTKYWVFGVGNNNFSNAYNEFIHYAKNPIKYDFGSHNLFLGLFVELGIFGFSFFIFAIVKHYQRICLKIKEFDTNHIMLKASFWGILTECFFSDPRYDKSFWLLWMLIMMNYKVITRHSNTASSYLRKHIVKSA